MISSIKLNLATLLIISSLGYASAQTSLSLSGAVAQAMSGNSDVNSARANLEKARAGLRAVRGDPSAIITTTTQAEYEVTAQASMLDGVKLSVMQAVVRNYMQAYETSLRVNLDSAQVSLGERNLAIAQARLKNKTTTQLDVSHAQAILNSDRQELSEAKSQLPVQEAQLARLLGINSSTDLQLSAPPVPPKLSTSLSTLQSGLEKRIPSLVQASNNLDLAKLQVSVTDNDYTPKRTFEDAKVTLENAQRGLSDSLRAATTVVRDSYRGVASAKDALDVAQEQSGNAGSSVELARARLQAGTAALVEVQQAEVQLKRAEFAVQQARDGIWQALAALSYASGVEVTGLVN